MEEPQFCDMEVIYSPAPADNGGDDEAAQPVLDIVIVGSMVDPSHQLPVLKSQGENQLNWFQDLLPEHISRARIMLFSRKSTAIEDTTQDMTLLSVENLTQFAKALLEKVAMNRTNDKYENVPITFVGYDLGGSIVKKALILASESQDEADLATFNNTRRLLFFGTPHRAHDIMSWVNLLFNILSSIRSSQSLKLNLHRRALEISKELDKLGIAFSSIAPRYSLINIHQENVDPAIDWGHTIVDRYSSTTGFVHETNISREKGYLDLGEFSQDIQTFSVIAKLLRIDSERAECLSKLLSLSLVSVVPVEEQFARLDIGLDLDAWLQAPSPAAIYVQGRQGAEDGPISSTLFRKLREKMLAAAYYSFSAQDRRRASAIPLLSSFVYQVLNQDPERFGRIRGLYHTLKDHSTWTRAALRTMFHALLGTDGLDTVFLVIDGIHDYDSHRKTLLDDFVHLVRDNRPPTKIKIAVFGQESQVLEELPETFGRIWLPLDSPVWPRQQVASLTGQAVARVIEVRPYLKQFELDLKAFLEKSEDPSQLALTLHALLDRTNSSPSSQASFRLKIQGVPSPVNDVVCSVYKTLPGWARRALGWVLYARRPLQLNELSTAIALFRSDGSTVTVFDESSLFLDISSELELAFGPLMTVNNGEVLLSNAQFGRYFTMALEEEQRQLSQASSAEIGTQQSVQAEILDDAQITLLLLRYLSSETLVAEVRKTLRQDPPGKFTSPLFAMAEYAVHFWPAHYREAEKQGLHYETILPFLNKREFVQTWSELNSSFDSTSSQPDFCITNGLDLAAQLGLGGAIKELQKDVKGDFRDLALTLASWGGHLDVVKTLLDDQFDQSPCNLTAAMKNASIGGYEEIVQLILDHRVNAKRVFSWDSEILCRAAEIGYEMEVMLFLDNEAPVDAPFGKSTPLQFAARNGHAAIVQLLLSRGADPNSEKAGDSLKPILEAVKSGQTLVLQHLLTSGARVAVCDEEERTPLHLAARDGQKKMVKLLLEHCKGRSQEDVTGDTTTPHASIEQPEANFQTNRPREIDRQDKSGSSPLALASKSGHVEVVYLLLAEVARVDLVDGDGHTALYIATKRGYNSIAEAILRHRDATTSFNDIDDVFLEASKAGFMNLLERLLDSPVDHKTVWKTLKDSATGMTALHYAASNGHDDVVRFLVQTFNVDVDLDDNDGNTPLMLAAVASKQGILRFLLDNKANPMHTNDNGQTVLHLVSAKEDTSSSTIDQEIVKTFLELGLSPNLKDNDKESALHQAAQTGNFAIAKALIQGGAEPMAKNRSFWTPLHKAACYGHDRICQLLIENGVDTLDSDDDGWTAMHVAARWGRVGVMKILAKASPDALSKRSLDGRTALHFASDELEATEWLLEQNLDKDATNESNETALIFASQWNCPRVVDILLRYGADLKLANDRKRTALHVAGLQGSADVVELILEKLSADAVNAMDETSKKLIADIVNAKDEDGLSPLQLAIREDETRCAIMLLKYPGIDVNVRDGEEMTPLMLAVDKKFEQSLVVTLLEIGRKAKGHEEDSSHKEGIHARDRQGRTALHIAAARHNRELFQLLVSCGADKEARDIQGRTVFHHAAMMRNKVVLDILLQDDTLKDLNVKDRHGWSPLHWACRTNRGAPVVQLLLQGKDVIVERSEPSVDGWTPENIAIFHDASAITDILQKPAEDAAESFEAEDSPRTERQQGQKRWKVGQRQWCRCDGCYQEPVYGIRWRCQDCDDFDYCFKCYWTAKETHPDHNFTKRGMGPETSPEYDEDVDTGNDTDEEDDEEDEEDK